MTSSGGVEGISKDDMMTGGRGRGVSGFRSFSEEKKQFFYASPYSVTEKLIPFHSVTWKTPPTENTAGQHQEEAAPHRTSAQNQFTRELQ